jgi:hypothetical protein
MVFVSRGLARKPPDFGPPPAARKKQIVAGRLGERCHALRAAPIADFDALGGECGLNVLRSNRPVERFGYVKREAIAGFWVVLKNSVPFSRYPLAALGREPSRRRNRLWGSHFGYRTVVAGVAEPYHKGGPILVEDRAGPKGGGVKESGPFLGRLVSRPE